MGVSNPSIAEKLTNANVRKSKTAQKIVKPTENPNRISSSLKRPKAAKPNSGGIVHNNGVEVSAAMIMKQISLLPDVSDANATAGESSASLRNRNLFHEVQPKRIDIWNPTRTSINERLNQARKFLSDQAVYKHPDFAQRHKEIGGFIAKLAASKSEYDAKTYKQVHAMLRLHQSWMDTQNKQIPRQADEKINSRPPPSFEWSKKYFNILNRRANTRAGDQRRLLRELGKSLTQDPNSPNEAQATELLSHEIFRENQEEPLSRKPGHEQNWRFTSELPDKSPPDRFFSLDRWPPPASTAPTPSPDVSMKSMQHRQRHITKHPNKAAKQIKKRKPPNTPIPLAAQAQKRNFYAVPYAPLGDSNGEPSRRLPPEELGFDEHLEASRDHTPEPGNGDLMPNEIRRFDYTIDAPMLPDAPDPKETHFPGDPSFPFAETPFVQSVMRNQIERDSSAGGISVSNALSLA